VKRGGKVNDSMDMRVRGKESKTAERVQAFLTLPKLAHNGF